MSHKCFYFTKFSKNENKIKAKIDLKSRLRHGCISNISLTGICDFLDHNMNFSTMND